MLALHAVWSSEAKLCIWGEDSALVNKAPRRNVRQARPAGISQHPFARDTDWLKEAILQISHAVEGLHDSSLSLLLPSTEEEPLSSPYLLRDEDGKAQVATQLRVWQVSVITLPAEEALNLLLALPEMSPPGVNMGDSLRFFSEVAKLALEFVSRGRAIPSLSKRGGKFRAQWQVFLTADFIAMIPLSIQSHSCHVAGGLRV